MDLRRLGRHEWVAMAGGTLLAVSVLLPWYTTDADSRFAQIEGARGDVSCWEAHPVLRWLLLLAAIAPFVLAWIIGRGHTLSWARGEMTAVVSIFAGGLVLYSGLIDKPGEPSGTISLAWGWLAAVLGIAAMFSGSALRASGVERPRKPPGTI